MIIFFIEGEHKTFFYVFDVKFKILTIDQKYRYAGTAVPVSPECPYSLQLGTLTVQTMIL